MPKAPPAAPRMMTSTKSHLLVEVMRSAALQDSLTGEKINKWYILIVVVKKNIQKKCENLWGFLRWWFYKNWLQLYFTIIWQLLSDKRHHVQRGQVESHAKISGWNATGGGNGELLEFRFLLLWLCKIRWEISTNLTQKPRDFRVPKCPRWHAFTRATARDFMSSTRIFTFCASGAMAIKTRQLYYRARLVDPY